jgi:rhamnose utilization protein RhaD (predicted bifunctional aldolase and dehydrogenase)
MSATRDTLLELSHFLGEERRQLAILGEGNTSAQVDEHTFLVKASGSCLQTLTSEDLVACRFDSLLPMLDQDTMSDQIIEDSLLASRVDASAKKTICRDSVPCVPIVTRGCPFCWAYT